MTQKHKILSVVLSTYNVKLSTVHSHFMKTHLTTKRF